MMCRSRPQIAAFVLKSEVHSQNNNLLISNLDVVCREENDKFGHNKATKGIILIHVFSSIFNHGWESDNSCQTMKTKGGDLKDLSRRI